MRFEATGGDGEVSDSGRERTRRPPPPPRSRAPPRARSSTEPAAPARAAQEADADHRQPVRDDGLGPAQEPRRLRAPGPLRGRGGPDRGPEPRHRDRARGPRRRLRRRRRVRRRRDAERGRQRARRHRRPGHRAARRLDQRRLPHARDPERRRRRHRAPARARRRLPARAGSTSASPTAAASCFACGAGLDATVAKRVDAHPKLKARVGRWFYTWAAISGFYTASTCATRSGCALDAARRAASEGVTAIVQNSDPFTYFGDRPVRVCREGVARRRHARDRDAAARRPARHADDHRAGCCVRALRGPPTTARSTTSSDVTEAPDRVDLTDADGRAAAVPGPGRRRLHRRPPRARARRSSPGALTVVA